MTMVDRRALIDAPERRMVAAAGFELREDGGALTLTGYAATFDEPYAVRGGPPGGWTEVVDRRAFDTTLAGKPDVHLLINHEGMPLARTKSGTLHLMTDQRGLKVAADLDPRDPDVARLAGKMRRGDMDEMSFAFRVKRDKWSDDDSQRRLAEVSLHKGDVSVVNFGANDGTSVQLNMRNVLDYLGHLSHEDAAAELRSLDGADDAAKRAGETLAALRRRLPGSAPRPLSLAEARSVVSGDLELESREADRGNITTPSAADLNAAARRYAATRGWAMRDGSYPIRPADMHGREDLTSAVRAVGRGGGSHDAIRRHIIKRARTLGATDAIPDNWNGDGSLKGDA